jgi:uncharacterized membrane protein
MKSLEFISRITLEDIEFYSVNALVGIGSIFTPWLQDLKEVLGVVVLVSVVIYNYWKIRNERKRHKKDSHNTPADDK